MTILLDTNIVIDILRDRPEATALISKLRQRPSISVASIMEVYRGARSRAEESKIERQLAAMKVLVITADIAQAAGRLAKHYQPSHGLDDIDALIAATAKHHALKLVTLNIKHFPMFAKLKPPY
jgi:predicted nucleic acid-binding protein